MPEAFDVIAYLATKGHKGKPVSGGREITYSCFFDCEEPPNSSKKKLYIHASDGVYHCKVCDASGGNYLLQKHFGDDPRPGSTNDPFMRRRILDSATSVGVDILNNNDDVLRYLLTERGLEPETIVERRLGFVAGGWSLTGSLPEDVTAEQLRDTGLVFRDGPRDGKDFFYRHLLLPYLTRGHTIQMRGRAWGEVKGGKYFTGPGEPTRLYNVDSLDGADEVIITEGEFDAMILAQTLAGAEEPRARKIAVISVPGVNAIPDEFDDVLSGARRIYLGLDSDEAGKKAADTLKDRIGTRALQLDLPYFDGRKCDWTEFLLPAEGPGSDWKNRHPYAGNTWRDVMRLLSHASGRRLRTMAESGVDYRAYRAINQGIQSGYTELDSVLRPGLLPGQVVVFLAKTGAGKTVFLCNLAYNMREKYVLFVSLEMTREEVYDRMRRIYLFHHPHHTEDDVDTAFARMMICDENRLGERDLEALVAEFVIETEHRPEVVMIDYLGYYARGAKGNSPYEKVSNAVMQLKQEAKAARFVIITPAQVNRGAKEGKPIDLDDARDAGSVEETADFLLALYRPDDGLTTEDLVDNRKPSGRVTITVLKSRHGGKGHFFHLLMDLITLTMVEPFGPKASRVQEHNVLSHGGKSWDEMRAYETRPRQMPLKGVPHG